MSLKNIIQRRNRWDYYFWTVCESVGNNSSCLSRQVGAILVRDNIIIATGYNGPPRGVPHCGFDRIEKDIKLAKALKGLETKAEKVCPRRVLGYPSGTHLEICTATHAEVNCIVNAARLGIPVKDATMYMNYIIPCRDCLKVLINAGIKELVIDSIKHYDDGSAFLLETSKLRIRTFNKGEI